MESLIDRWFDRVEINGITECWPWLGAKLKTGYGQVWIGRNRLLAHRVSFLLSNGFLPKELVMHKCNNPSCVNPSHLVAGTNSDNLKYAYACGRGKGFRMGFGTPNPWFSGEKNPFHKLTTKQVRKIRELYLEDGSWGRQTILARMFKVGQPQIWRIVNDQERQSE